MGLAWTWSCAAETPTPPQQSPQLLHPAQVPPLQAALLAAQLQQQGLLLLLLLLPQAALQEALCPVPPSVMAQAAQVPPAQAALPAAQLQLLGLLLLLLLQAAQQAAQRPVPLSVVA